MKPSLKVVLLVFIVMGGFKIMPDKKEPKINRKPELTYIFEVKKKHNLTIHDTWLTVKYMAVNRACDKTLFPSGVKTSLLRLYSIPIRGAASVTEAVIESDLFEPGYCNWRLANIAVSWDSPKYGRQSTSIGSLLPNPIYSIPKKNFEYSCSLLAARLKCYGADEPSFKLNSNDFNIRRIK